jgi:RNA polymerase sigma-70 factor (ECF subfamily)
MNRQKMAPISDQDILRSLGENPRDGMRLLFDKYYIPLVAYAGRFLRDRARAEDIVQEFYIRLWHDDYLGRAPVHALSSYLYTGVRNSCYSHYTKKDLLRDPVALSGVEIPIEAFTEITDDRIERVRREIDRLPERTRRVVQGVMLRELSYKEVAAELSISVNTVKFLLKEGVRRLRDKFQNGAREIFFLFFGKKKR